MRSALRCVETCCRQQAARSQLAWTGWLVQSWRGAVTARTSQQQQSFRRSAFDLPVDQREQPQPKYKLPELANPDEPSQETFRMDQVSASDIGDLWPPPDLVAEPPPLEEVKRPHLWLTDTTVVGIEDVGRFIKLQRDELIEFLPEGPCGELARDLTLVPSSTRPIGLMLRKLTVELISQLWACQKETDGAGRPRIRKAGFLVDGHKGTGKSQVLNTIAMWARQNGWLVVLEPTPSRYAKQIADIKRSNNGVYIQNEFAQQFLEATSLANRQMLEDLPVDFSAYGTRAIDGESVKATNRLYEPLIDITVDRELASDPPSHLSRGEERLQRIAAYRQKIRVPHMADQLPEPVNVWEILEFGLENEAFATQAVSELFIQLQRQTMYPVLVIVDEWNECFPASDYVSIRYDNTRFGGKIPAYHLTMPRAFHNWDGKLYRRGLKLYATSWMRSQRRDYRPELLGVSEHEIRTVRSFSQHEFANYVMYLRLMKVLHNFPRSDLEYYYMLTQGNGYQARKLLSTLY